MTTTDSPTPPAPVEHVGSPWLPMAVIMAATVMVVLDTTIVNVALHQIGVDLGAGDGIEWVVTSYLLAVCAAQPATGWLADRFGRKHVFMGSVLAFTVASAACAMAPTLPILVLFRVLQGLGGGALMPVGMAMVFDLFPRERHGRAIAVWGMAAMVAPAIGPTLGGWLVTSVNWHWLFLINVPIGAVALVAGIKLLPDIGYREQRPFDLAGLVLGTMGLTLAVLGVAEGSSWGWTSPATLACLVVGVVSLAMFVHHELRADHPLVDLRMFSQRTFRLAMSAYVFVIGAQYARLVFIPLQLESLRGFTALRVGMMFFVPAVFMAVGMPIGGRLVDRIGPRRPIMIGCAGMFIAVFSCSRLTLTTPVWVIVGLLSIQGLGVGITTAPTMVAGISELPPRLVSQGTAVRSLINQMSGAIAIAVLGTVVAGQMGRDPTPEEAQGAYNAAFLVTSMGLLVALVIASRLPARTRSIGATVPHALVAE